MADDYRRGLPDHHDPTGGIGGATPAYSALTLRLVLAGFGLLAGLVLTFVAWRRDAGTVLIVLPALMALVALVNIGVVARRKRRGEPG